MCLLNYGSPKIAEEDIVCYKVVTEQNGFFLSYYIHKPYSIGKTYTSELTSVDSGIHSYKKLLDANHVRYHEKHEAHVDNVCVLRCTIPKGSTYYEGTHNVYEFYSADAYVSDNIKIENLIVKS